MNWHVDRARGDGGLTLVELSIAMVVSSVVGAAAVLGITTVMGTQRDIRERADAQQQAQLAADQIASQVRSGNVLYQPTSTASAWSLMVYTQANGAQKCVEWEVDKAGGDLTTRSWTPDWNLNSQVDAGEVSDWRVVARGLVNGSTVDPFEVPSAAPYGSRLLNIDLRLDDGTAGGLEVGASATGRNTQYGYDNDVCEVKP